MRFIEFIAVVIGIAVASSPTDVKSVRDLTAEFDDFLIEYPPNNEIYDALDHLYDEPGFNVVEAHHELKAKPGLTRVVKKRKIEQSNEHVEPPATILRREFINVSPSGWTNDLHHMSDGTIQQVMHIPRRFLKIPRLERIAQYKKAHDEIL